MSAQWTDDNPGSSNPDGLRILSTQLSEAVKDLATAKTALATAIGAATEKWSGAAAQAFVDEATGLLPEFHTIGAVFEADSGNVANYAQTLDDIRSDWRSAVAVGDGAEEEWVRANRSMSAAEVGLTLDGAPLDRTDFTRILHRHQEANDALIAANNAKDASVQRRRAADNAFIAGDSGNSPFNRYLADGKVFSGLTPAEQLKRISGMSALELELLHQKNPALFDGLISYPIHDGVTESEISRWQSTVSKWWASLSPAEQAALGIGAAALIGNLNGIPWVPARTAANRLNVQREIDRLTKYRKGLTATVPVSDYGLTEPNPEITRVDQLLATYRKILSDNAQVVVFDPRDDGKYAELHGTLDASTRNVGVLVPGTTNNMVSAAGSFDKTTTSFFVNGEQNHDHLAMITWMGCDLPNEIFPNAVSTSYAEKGGGPLAAFQIALDHELKNAAAGGPEARTVLAGHSYGGSIVGDAEKIGFPSTAVMHIESAGAGPGVWNVDQYADPDRQRYSMIAPGDPMGEFRGYIDTGVGHIESPHGADPNLLPGVKDLTTGDYTNGKVIQGSDAHSGVFQPQSDAWTNMYDVFTDRSPTLVHQ